MEIVVVDDGSTDSTREALRAEHPGITVLPGDGTLWWTGAMAKAVDALKPRFRPGDFLMSLNNDTQVDPDTISRLVEVSLSHGRAMVTAATRREDGRYVAAGARLSFGRTLGTSIALDPEEGQGRFGIVEADAIFGRTTLVPVEVFDTIGTYNPQEFPQYWGDSDFSLRAQRAGIRQLVTFSATVKCTEDQWTTGLHHAESGVISFRRAAEMLLSRRSTLCLSYGARFMWRHAPKGSKLLSILRYWVRSLFLVFQQTLLGFLVLKIMHFARRVAGRVLPCQLLTYPEIRKLGFDPKTLIQERIIAPGRIRHAYWIPVPFLKIWWSHPQYRRLVLHSRNPLNRVRKARWSRRALRREERAGSRGRESV
jgi:GT2 family glycosyltransferase